MICAIENPQDFRSLQIVRLNIYILIEVGGKHKIYTLLPTVNYSDLLQKSKLNSVIF